MNEECENSRKLINDCNLLPKLDALLAVPNFKIHFEIISAISKVVIISNNCTILIHLGTHQKIVDLMPITNTSFTIIHKAFM